MKSITIGRMTRFGDYSPRMADAIECDLEQGSHWMNNWASTRFAAAYPTILQMALLVDLKLDQLEKKGPKHGRQQKRAAAKKAAG